MTLRRTPTIRVVVCVILVAGPRLATGQGAAPAGAPSHLEVAVPDAPTVMLTPDAERLRSSLVGEAPPSRPPGPAAGGVSRTIQLERPPIVNRSSQFVYRDVTDRPQRLAIPMEVRRAVFDAYRQSLVEAKGQGR